MCGLVGIAGDTNVALKDAFKDMLLVNQVRGRDSTGVFSVRGDDVHVSKTLGVPEYLFDTKSFDSALTGCPKIMAGHCRSKTVGENTRQNAHPYEFDNLVGMHNGTLRNYYSWKSYDHKRTDSFALYQSINDRGLDETFADLDPSGAWALVWYDKTDKTLNFLRNSERPLWFTWTKNKRAILWASEPWFFGAARRRTELWDGVDDNGDERSPLWQLPENELWSFNVNDRAPMTERTLTAHPVRQVKAEGKQVSNFTRASTTVGYHGDTNKGGSVVHPFARTGRQNLDDPVGDIGQPGVTPLPQRKAITHCRVVSTNSSSSVNESEKTSSNASDTRSDSTHGTSSSRNILSLLWNRSKACLPSSNGVQSSMSGSCQNPPNPDLSSTTSPLIDLRKLLGKQYITDRKTGREYSEQQFELATNGVCSFCKSPIGDLNEVAEFLSPTNFVCSGCWSEPDMKPLQLKKVMK